VEPSEFYKIRRPEFFFRL